MTLQPGTAIGKYLVRRQLAEGGMAEIYLATVQGPEGFEKEVVIKRVRAFAANDPGFVQMFIAEARVASRLNHANLVQIFDFDKHEETYYLAMEYVRGKSLWDIRKRSKELMLAMPPTLAAYVCTKVARGLGHAHRLTDRGRPLRLVHRDVTPHNVLISFEGAVKLTDFGIAKAAGQRLTSPGMLKGKFAYMSPEQARGDEVDARSDLFSLGVVLWEMITGGRLFDGDSDVAVLKAVQQSVIPPPARLNPEVPEALDAIVMRALSREVEHRFQTAQELERALAQYVLSVSKSVDETDLPAYLEKLFPEESTASMTAPAGESPGSAVTVASVPGGAAAEGQLSPDEDPEGLTFVAPGRPGEPPPGEGSDTVPLGKPGRRGRQPERGGRLSRRAGAGRRRLAIAGAGLALAVGVAAVGLLLPVAQAPNSSSLDAGPPPLAASQAPAGAAPGPRRGADAGGGEDGGEAAALTGRAGVLVVRATPWATLFIDGKPRGEIDGTRRRILLPPGGHSVLFRHPSRSQSFRVNIEPDRETAREFSATP